MNYKILTRFSIDGLRKNKRTIVPFLAVSSLTIMIYYILYSMAFSPYIYYEHKEAFYGAQIIAILLEAASGIVSIFAAIFLIYANQFVMRERKREIGLYGVLGLSKKHITYIMVLETLIKAAICIVSGIAAGTFLNKLMLLALYKIIKQPPVSGIMFTPRAVKQTIILFAVFFAICLVSNVRAVNIGNPIELLRSTQTGEKEPKVKWLMLIIGVAALFVGYYGAISCKSTMEAFNTLIESAVYVMVATYCLFITGSIFFLKLLKKNKKFYYKTNNFISVSSLIYRMKHNAAGLASICILSTAVILLMTCAVSLMLLGEKNINNLYKADVKLEITDNRDKAEEYYTSPIKSAADFAQMDVENLRFYRYRESVWIKAENSFSAVTKENGIGDNASNVYLMSIDDYSKYADTDAVLAADEVLMYASDNVNMSQFEIFGEPFKVMGTVEADKISAVINPSMSLYESYIIVFNNESTIKNILKNDTLINNADMFDVYVGFDTNKLLTDNQIEQFEAKLNELVADDFPETYDVKFKQVERAFFYNMYGGAFFVGVFLSVLFLMATVMIIYYKQMSEGFEDSKRYQILSYVGLTEPEIKSTIKRQVIILFFLPVVTAIIHMMAASNIVRLFLKSVLIVDAFTFNIAVFAVVLVFVVVYTLVYKITSGQYYKYLRVNNLS